MANFISSSLQIIGDYRAELGETPMWCARSQSLLWVDILQQRLLRYWPDEDGRIEIHAMPPFTSAVLLTELSECFLVVSQQGIALYDYAHQHLEFFCAYPANAQDTRPNEAAIAPDGSLWFSSMDPQAKRAIGSWYRLNGKSDAVQHLTGNLLVPNTLQWVDDDIWFADSLRHTFYRATFQADSLNIQQEYPVSGIPDGSTLTTQRQLINSNWGEHCLTRYQISGAELQEVDRFDLPVSQPSCCTFGGSTLSDLYVTSASCGLPHPKAVDGGLIKIETTLTGSLSHQFKF
jgi:sugar lactone lactonase YvrE